MLHQPIKAPEWFEEPAAKAVIGHITLADFSFGRAHSFLTDEYQWSPITDRGFGIVEDLTELRRSSLTMRTGIICDEFTSAEEMARFLEASKACATVYDVIAARMADLTKAGWNAAMSSALIAPAWRAA